MGFSREECGNCEGGLCCYTGGTAGMGAHDVIVKQGYV